MKYLGNKSIKHLISKIKKENADNIDSKFWTGTQAQYDAIQEKDTNTLYCIVEE